MIYTSTTHPNQIPDNNPKNRPLPAGAKNGPAAVPIAALGLLHPMIGVIAMTTSTLSVIGNSLLLKRSRFKV